MGGKARGFDPLDLGPMPERRDTVGRILLRRLVGEQELHDHAARLDGTFGRRLHHHVGRRLADAGGSQNALAIDLDHAGAAIAIGTVTGLRQPAKMRDVDALALGNLPYGFARPRSDDLAVDGEKEFVGHVRMFLAKLAIRSRFRQT